MARDFDSPWKEVLDEFFEQFLSFFYPDLHAAVDWSRGVEVLDVELRQIVRAAELGTAQADKLVRVWRGDGSPLCVLVHVEVQSWADPDFARRLFVYHYRILDRYNQDVVTLAVLGDDRPHWRPTEYVRELWGGGVRFWFRAVKLLDYAHDLDRLERDANPLGLMVAAHLQSLLTAEAAPERRAGKWRLIRGLYDRGLTPDGLRQLYRLVDWFVNLPPAAETQLLADVAAFEKEQIVPYVTSAERIGEERGLLTGLEVVVENKFGPAGLAYLAEVRPGCDLAGLRRLLATVLAAASVDELRSRMAAGG